ncbi:HNH endonuclease [Haloferax mucosum]|uniref:HNH endonuclease n=1 Tax=Haloferax mucosum TaxID=403181 RepID=UPI000A015E0B
MQTATRRDQFRCQDCGVTQPEHIKKHERKLDVHHIVPARQFDDPGKRNAMDNLVTLCRVCHAKWERMSGLRPNTREQPAD